MDSGTFHKCNSASTLAAFIGSVPDIYEKAGHYVTFQWRVGKDRTLDQNALSFQCYSDLHKAKPESYPDVNDARAHCKLHYGVVIMRRDDAYFNEQYSKLILERFTYEEKLQLMLEPVDFPVTRNMTRKQFTEYVSRMAADFPDVKFRALEELEG